MQNYGRNTESLIEEKLKSSKNINFKASFQKKHRLILKVKNNHFYKNNKNYILQLFFIIKQLILLLCLYIF